MSKGIQGIMPLMYSTEEVARILNVSARTIRREIVAGRLKATRVGVQWRVALPEIPKYIARFARDEEDE